MLDGMWGCVLCVVIIINVIGKKIVLGEIVFFLLMNFCFLFLGSVLFLGV